MFDVEMNPPFSRGLSSATAIAGYAGGRGEGVNGQVCYHGGPSGTYYGEPNGLHYAEAVQILLDANSSLAVAQFEALCHKYFSETFHEVVSDAVTALENPALIGLRHELPLVSVVRVSSCVVSGVQAGRMRERAMHMHHRNMTARCVGGQDGQR